MNPEEELARIFEELRDPCDAFLDAHRNFSAAVRAGDADAMRRLLPQLETARFVCTGLACGIVARLSGYFESAGAAARRRQGNGDAG